MKHENVERVRIGSNDLVVGDDINKLYEIIEKLLKETMEIRDELANLNCPHPLMTKKDVAEYLQVSIKTVENMMKSNELAYHYVGKLPRFKRKEVDTCLQRSEVRFFKP
jgi:excisionase family DNA binding protein